MQAEASAPPIPWPWSDKYELRSMIVGDSKFLVVKKGRKSHYLMRAVHQHGSRNDKKFICRSVEEGGKKGVRIWRTA